MPSLSVRHTWRMAAGDGDGTGEGWGVGVPIAILSTTASKNTTLAIATIGTIGQVHPGYDRKGRGTRVALGIAVQGEQR